MISITKRQLVADIKAQPEGAEVGMACVSGSCLIAQYLDRHGYVAVNVYYEVDEKPVMHAEVSHMVDGEYKTEKLNEAATRIAIAFDFAFAAEQWATREQVLEWLAELP
jgi:hypothetical protein